MKKKLIEVALPLEAINMESAREKSIRHGHPSTLHLWWARRPLAACRAVLWASLVDDPSSWPDKFPTEEDQKRERQRLFDILGRIVVETDNKGNQKQVVRGLVSWNDVNDPKSKVLENAQREIARCLAWDRNEEPPVKPDAVRNYIAKYAPPAYDPFAGGGSIPLEAQRLGLEAHASDLNPVAVLINKALIEIPPKFKDQPPVNPEDRQKKGMSSWKGAQGLAADVRYYGKWMRDEAFKRIGHLYPKVKVIQDKDGNYHHANNSELQSSKSNLQELTIMAWIWARTVKCPNPACNCTIPLLQSLELSTKKNNKIWLEPRVETYKNQRKIHFSISSGEGEIPRSPKIGRGAKFMCIACEQPVNEAFIKEQGKKQKIGYQLVAIVAEGIRGKAYLEADEKYLPRDLKEAENIPTESLAYDPRNIWCVNYGIDTYDKLFYPRQAIALETFSQLIFETSKKIDQDISQILKDDNSGTETTNLTDYSKSIAVYLGCALSRACDFWNCAATWEKGGGFIAHLFTRQAIPMVWDFAEANPFSQSSGNWENTCIDWVQKVIEGLPSGTNGKAFLCDASHENGSDKSLILSTDPPYYDNISYADLSDFFYVWLRRSVSFTFPEIFQTLLVPKEEELVATPYRLNRDKKAAQSFFEAGLEASFSKMHKLSQLEYPLTLYYAFKQAESSQGKADEVASTGWETMLTGLIHAQFTIDGTWPMRTERSVRTIGIGTNALASSIVLVCRPRPTDAPKITRRQFLTELQRELPRALKTLQQGNVAPVDLAQASIGPGMAVFSKYAAVLENDGSPMRVRTALQLINQVLDEFLTEQEGEFDGDTRWALTWFEQYQFQPGQYGDAETLSKAKNTSVQGMVDAGILEAKGGKVRLLKRDELKSDWNPNSDSRMPDWEVTQYLMHELDQQGEMGAAKLLAKLGSRGESARDLAYRLYSLCDRKGWAQEGIAYNSLVISWPEITRLATEVAQAEPVQSSLF